MILNNMLSSMVDTALEEREGHVTVVLEDVGKPLLETAAVLHEVGNVAPGEGVVQHLQKDVVQEGEEVALHQVPDHRAQQVEDVVDGGQEDVDSDDGDGQGDNDDDDDDEADEELVMTIMAVR